MNLKIYTKIHKSGFGGHLFTYLYLGVEIYDIT